jgi:hypothetical protein
MVVFDAFSLQGLDPVGLCLGDWVEYDDMDWNEGRRALIVKRHSVYLPLLTSLTSSVQVGIQKVRILFQRPQIR